MKNKLLATMLSMLAFAGCADTQDIAPSSAINTQATIFLAPTACPEGFIAVETQDGGFVCALTKGRAKADILVDVLNNSEQGDTSDVLPENLCVDGEIVVQITDAQGNLTYACAQEGGVNVATGDVLGDGSDDIQPPQPDCAWVTNADGSVECVNPETTAAEQPEACPDGIVARYYDVTGALVTNCTTAGVTTTFATQEPSATTRFVVRQCPEGTIAYSLADGTTVCAYALVPEHKGTSQTDLTGGSGGSTESHIGGGTLTVRKAGDDDLVGSGGGGDSYNCLECNADLSLCVPAVCN